MYIIFKIKNPWGSIVALKHSLLLSCLRLFEAVPCYCYCRVCLQYLAAGCWLLFTCIGVLLVYIPYTEHVDGLEPWTPAQHAAFEALGRPAWALCVGWVVYACAAGYGGRVAT